MVAPKVYEDQLTTARKALLGRSPEQVFALLLPVLPSWLLEQEPAMPDVKHRRWTMLADLGKDVMIFLELVEQKHGRGLADLLEESPAVILLLAGGVWIETEGRTGDRAHRGPVRDRRG